jgi:hypothetical protein
MTWRAKLPGTMSRLDRQMFQASHDMEGTNNKLREQSEQVEKGYETRVRMRSLQHSSELKTQFVVGPVR